MKNLNRIATLAAALAAMEGQGKTYKTTHAKNIDPKQDEQKKESARQKRKRRNEKRAEEQRRLLEGRE